MKQEINSRQQEDAEHPQHHSRGKSVGKAVPRSTNRKTPAEGPGQKAETANKNTAIKEETQASISKPQAAGAMIGSYRVTKTLGQGTFGKKVAIKILEKNKITDVNDVERVTREIHILKIVSHPNIIQLYEIIETPSRLFLIMEHCCNGELFSYITSKNKLKEEESCRLFQQLIAALEYLGRLGIVHRDVKPENLLLDEQLNLKVVDFGLSNTFRPGEKLATACGSPCYAAPELIKGLEYTGPKADLWSAGVVLYTLVCGHLPFEDNNTQSLYQKILSADYKFTCYLSREVRNLIENILVPDPELRYGLKQITSNSWFKNAHPVAVDITTLGRQVGMDPIKIYTNVIDQMAQNIEANVDGGYAKKCLHANRYNAVTSHYYLLIKKKTIEGEPLIAEKVKGEEVKNEDGSDTVPEQRIHYHLNPSQRALIAAGRQTKKYQSIEPQRTTLYNEKNKYQLRKIAEGLHEFSNIKRIAVPDNSVAASTANQSHRAQEQPYQAEIVQSPVGASGTQIAAPNVAPGGSGSTANPGQKFLFSPTLTDEAAEEEDDDYLLSQQKGQNNPQQMIFSPTGARTNNHFRQFPISPKTTATANAIEKAPLKQNQVSLKKAVTNQSQKTTESATSNKRPFDSSSAVTMTIDGGQEYYNSLANALISSDDQGNQIYEIFEGLGQTSSSALIQNVYTGTVGDMLNKPDTGFELFGKGHRSSSIGASPTKLSGMDSSCPGTLPPAAHMSVMDFLSDKILPAPTQQQRTGRSYENHARNRNCSSYQLERNGGSVGGARVAGLGGSGGVTPGQPAYKRKTAYGSGQPAGGSHQKTKKKSGNRGEHYTRKASSNLDFLQKGSTVQQVNQTNSNTTNNSQGVPYARPGGAGQNTKLFDQQIRQILNQSQIVESANNNGMLLIESGATSVGASDLRKITSQLSKNMPNYSRISAMSNYNTSSVRGSKQTKPKVRGSHSGQNQNATVQHGLLGGLSTGIKLQGNSNNRKTLRSTRENLDQVKNIPSNTGKIQQAARIPPQNSLRKGSVSVISPSQKAARDPGSSGTTANTRLISSGSHLQGGNLIKTSSTVTHAMNQTIQPSSNNTATKGKGSKKTISNQNQIHQQKLDALKNLDKEISITFQHQITGGQTVQQQQQSNEQQTHTQNIGGQTPGAQLTNNAILTSLVSPNNQAAAHFLTQHHSGATTAQAAHTQHGTFLPTSPLSMIQNTPGINPRMGAATSFGNNETTINNSVALKPPKGLIQTPVVQPQLQSRVGSTGAQLQQKQRKPKPSQVQGSSNTKATASLNAYLVQNTQNQHNTSSQKHRNAVARANSTVTYASMTNPTQQRTQQLSDFIVPSQFVNQDPLGGTVKQTSAKAAQIITNTPQVGNTVQIMPTTTAANNTSTKMQAQGSRNMHARAMTSLGTSGQIQAPHNQFLRGQQSIISPNSNVMGRATTTLTNDLIELKPKMTLMSGNPTSNKKNPPQHKRGASMMNQTQPIGNTNVVMFPNQTNNYLVQQAQVKPQLAQTKTPVIANSSIQSTLQQQKPVQAQSRRPPSARQLKNKAPGNQTVNVQGISQLMSPTAAQMLNQAPAIKR